MFTSVVAALALAASVSRVAASPIEHVARGYRQDAELLEDYTPYHVRYIALNCQGQHQTPFFEECCHPLLRWQKLSDRPAKCIPSPTASASAVLAEPSAPVIDEDPIPVYGDDDCDDESATAPVSSYIAPAQVTSRYIPPATVASSSIHRSSSTPQLVTSTQEPVTYQEPVTEAPSSTHRPSSTKVTSEAQATSSAAPSSGGGDNFEGGFATFFSQGGNAGACGDFHGDYDLVVAADYRRYGPLDKKSDLCGKKVQITNIDNGKQVTAIVADACPTCKNNNSLDLSLGAFDKIGARDTGMLNIVWHFV